MTRIDFYMTTEKEMIYINSLLAPEYLKRLSMLQDNATFTATVPAFLRDSLAHLPDYRLLLFGAIMVIMMLYRPQGLLGGSRRKEEILNR